VEQVCHSSYWHERSGLGFRLDDCNESVITSLETNLHFLRGTKCGVLCSRIGAVLIDTIWALDKSHPWTQVTSVSSCKDLLRPPNHQIFVFGQKIEAIRLGTTSNAEWRPAFFYLFMKNSCTTPYAFSQLANVHHPQQKRLKCCHHIHRTKILVSITGRQ
jgi:hypothetical protein